MARAAATSGVSAAEVDLEAWVGRAELESLGSDLLDAVRSETHVSCSAVVLQLWYSYHDLTQLSGLWDSSNYTRRTWLLWSQCRRDQASEAAWKCVPPSAPTRPTCFRQRARAHPRFCVRRHRQFSWCWGQFSRWCRCCFVSLQCANFGHAFGPRSLAPNRYVSMIVPRPHVSCAGLSIHLMALALIGATGAASSCFKIDSAKSSCPPLPVLLRRMRELKSLPLDSARLLSTVGRLQH